jgi:hypothetical protein
MTPKFIPAFEKYCSQIEKAVINKASHDQRRYLFLEFLHDGFGLAADQVELEKGLFGLQVKGFIDALYQDIVIEFKKYIDQERDEGKKELKKYIQGLKSTGSYFGIITDGLMFEVYVLEPSGLTQIDSVKLTNLDSPDAFVWLDRYFFSTHTLTPTADDLVSRFGPSSPVFISSMRSLGELFKAVASKPAMKVKLDQWFKLLTRVYGSSVGDEQLFLRHTYLSVLARILGYLALCHAKPENKEVEGLISGEVFHKMGLMNFIEEDFFGWLLEPAIVKQSRGWVWSLLQYYSVYDTTKLTGDLLKELYQALVDPETRRDLGEFYTPDWLATLTIENISFEYPQSVLDPACGSGTFLAAAIQNLRGKGITGPELLDWVESKLCGLDIHPLAIITSKATLVLSLAEDLASARRKLTLPVYLADAIPRFQPTQEGDLLIIPTSKDENFKIPVKTAKEPAKLDKTVDFMVSFAKAGTDLKIAKKGFLKKLEMLKITEFIWAWTSNLSLLHKYIKEGRNTIWAFILKNQY